MPAPVSLLLAGALLAAPTGGHWQLTADRPTAGLHLTVVGGRLLELSEPGGTPLVVLGTDGQPYLRFTSGRVSVVGASPSAVADRAARALPAADGPQPGTSWTWYDPRAALPASPPSDPGRGRVVSHWTVPVLLGGAPDHLSGTVRWTVPATGHRYALAVLLALTAIAGLGAAARLRVQRAVRR